MKPAILDPLAQCLRRHIDRSFILSERSIQLTPPDDPGRPRRLSNLGTYLLRRLERLRDVNNDDINKSIRHLREARDASLADGPGDPRILASLGTALVFRFISEGRLSDIDDAIGALDKAVALVPANHRDKHVMLNNLGSALNYRYERINRLDDLNRAVTVYWDAVELAPERHSDRLSWRGHLGDALRCRFERLGHLGDIKDLNEAVKTLKEVVEDTPPDDPELFVPLNNLANALQCRFEWFGARKDIDEAILALQEASLMLADHPRKPLCLSNLGSALLNRFKRYEDESDIENASGCRVLNNFGNAHLQRYKWKGDDANLDEAISALQKAAGYMSDDHAVKPTVLNNLSNALQNRGSPSDIKASIRELERTDREKKALAHYRSAACSSTGPAGVRFEASMNWAYLEQISGDQSLYAYQVALDLLPDVAWLGVTIPDRHQLIMKAGEFVRDAAAAAIAAVEWLEQGRSIIWGQLLDLRTPVKELEKQHPGVARQLISLSQQLEGAGDGNSRPEGVLTSQAEKQPSMQTVADSTHQYAQQRRELLKKVRGLENFNDFGLPKTRSKLVQAAREGPVVILNVSNFGCDALLLRPGEADIMHVRLPDFKVDDADIMAKDLKDAVGGREGGPAQEDERTGKRERRNPDDTLHAMLRTLWHRVVKPVLDALEMTPLRNPPRMWWCPTGSLAFLPVHAAGLYGQHDTFGSKLSDFVVSSYAPSLTALIAAFNIRSARRGDVKILAVTQSSASGHRCIPGTEEEVSRIKVICDAKVPVIQLDGNAVTKASVEDDASNPTQSALLISGDSRFTLSDIINLSLRDKDLAYLSACQTATGAKAFQEESVHLGAGMLCAGFSGVIATMWSIGDRDAPHVAADVYEQLFKTPTPDSSQAAKALHLATMKLQQKSGGEKFVNWVPYIHIGV
ncbi:CHAT domain-containing protein [Mycena pura]|uniref:CHAT domain-containing protein n=1 Tax=Mycena pura TaxID=153505 RepID=A0AAD6Y4P5_9AGAR|nr:CHAT domain-containing protein [Mycena pura]